MSVYTIQQIKILLYSIYWQSANKKCKQNANKKIKLCIYIQIHTIIFSFVCAGRPCVDGVIAHTWCLSLYLQILAEILIYASYWNYEKKLKNAYFFYFRKQEVNKRNETITHLIIYRTILYQKYQRNVLRKNIVPNYGIMSS